MTYENLEAGLRLAVNMLSQYEPADSRAVSCRRTSTRQPKLGGMSRKHVSDKYCGGITCLPGLGGGCVACSEDDD
jgi:hypothetical protein